MSEIPIALVFGEAKRFRKKKFTTKEFHIKHPPLRNAFRPLLIAGYNYSYQQLEVRKHFRKSLMSSLFTSLFQRKRIIISYNKKTFSEKRHKNRAITRN